MCHTLRVGSTAHGQSAIHIESPCCCAPQDLASKHLELSKLSRELEWQNRELLRVSAQHKTLLKYVTVGLVDRRVVVVFGVRSRVTRLRVDLPHAHRGSPCFGCAGDLCVMS